MRDLKFRAWDNKAKEWLLGYGYKSLGGFSLFGECILLGEWNHVINRFILQQHDRTPEDLIVEQYTGRADKNGKDIYEGDVLGDHRGMRETVSWSDGYSAFVVRFHKNHGGVLLSHNGTAHKEVIGNIHENPELLK